MKARIGVMSEEMLRKRTIAIVKGEYKPASDEPKVWFTSLNAVAQLFCDENQRLLQIIDEYRPETITELAELTGRQKTNLSETLKKLATKGFVRLEKQGKAVRPIAIFTSCEIIVENAYECSTVKEAA
ncbi:MULTISPECIES: MarR family transcriptional regulator [Photobacterium]|jgi:predicted transcriptional regulator|uniref:MarR family protein n=1 Tax=Photobacterium malacitanum TaxID=2204294 RepID=A0A1Y6MRA7_9GAMM|nr:MULTISPECIES: MarR family transcriptional regulator [Photobacterium]MCD9496702.1 MarR family transcriptional regulator [Photobacterium carnosum]SMY39104.1 MarR family protein [Photobacterium malacitanum]